MLTSAELEELERLQAEHRNNGMGDRPHGMAAQKLLRLMELEHKAASESQKPPASTPIGGG